jgi:ABC-type transport system involved in cytochrome c biogenesis permease subunit
MLAGLVWAVYTFYLYLHYGRSASGRTTAWVAIAGLVIVTAVAITARMVPAGFHVFGVAG